MLGVSSETLAAHGAVSEETAAEMARGIRNALGADITVSVTGIAGPGGGTPEKPVGTVFVGLSTKDGEKVKRLTLSSMRDRDYLRFVSASNAIHFALSNIF
jgi:nicotinamide-nucleotide amidase